MIPKLENAEIVQPGVKKEKTFGVKICMCK